MRRAPQNPHRNAGYIAADAIIALAIVLLLLSLLSVSVARQRRGSERLADSRAAIRLAEETVTALQTGATPPPPPQGITVQVKPTEAKPQLEAPAGSTWVEVVVSYGTGRSSSLCGIVRADAAKGAMK